MEQPAALHAVGAAQKAKLTRISYGLRFAVYNPAMLGRQNGDFGLQKTLLNR
jgi:hypothetical protein